MYERLFSQVLAFLRTYPHQSIVQSDIAISRVIRACARNKESLMTLRIGEIVTFQDSCFVAIC